MNNRSQGWFHLSTAKFNSFKHYKGLTNGALSPCMYLHNRMTRFVGGTEVGITETDKSWYTTPHGDLFSSYDWWQHKNDNWLDGCLDVLKVTSSQMCNFENSWSSGTWHGLNSNENAEDQQKLDIMDAIQLQYREHLRINCRDSGSNLCEDTQNETYKMCKNAHDAELVIDQIAVLGVGCPIPKPKYMPPPPLPCWFYGEHNCPDPELEKCD